MNSPKKRRPGRPKKAERPCTPEVIQEIGRLWLYGRSVREIGAAIGVAPATVDHHLAHTIKPLWRNAIQWDASIELARADEVIRLAFEGYDRSRRRSTKERQKFSIDELKKTVKKKAPAAANKEKLVERTVERIKRDGDRGWLELVAAMMDFKAKVKGGYAPARLNVNQQSELRVAGLNPAQLDDLMLERLLQLAEERQHHHSLLETASRAAGVEN